MVNMCLLSPYPVFLWSVAWNITVLNQSTEPELPIFDLKLVAPNIEHLNFVPWYEILEL